jgi:enoyl-CoA hydratase/carnithine racemase
MAGLTVSNPSDGVLDVELDRAPDNLLTIELCGELTELLLRPPADAHVLRLRAAGPVFCLGRERAGTTPGDLRTESAALVGLHRALRNTPLVTVAQVHGDAAGFGVGMLAACDVAVATADARFWFPEVGIGLAPALVLAWLPKVVGQRQAFWLTATGEKISAERARELDLINAVVPDQAALVSDVDARIAALRAHRPRVHAEIKEMLLAGRAVDEDLALTMSIDRLVVGSLRRTEETAQHR